MRVTHSTAIVLLALARDVRYGFDIIDATGLRSGTVYPILRRLEDAGLVRSSWERTAIARDAQRPPRRYYQLTGGGAEAVQMARQRFPRLERALGPVRPATA